MYWPLTHPPGAQRCGCVLAIDIATWGAEVVIVYRLLTRSTWGRAEMLHLRNALPEEVVVQRIDERLNSLGNCIACNDYVALVHPDIDKARASFGSLHGRTAHRSCLRSDEPCRMRRQGVNACHDRAMPLHERLWAGMLQCSLEGQWVTEGEGLCTCMHPPWAGMLKCSLDGRWVTWLKG